MPTPISRAAKGTSVEETTGTPTGPFTPAKPSLGLAQPAFRGASGAQACSGSRLRNYPRDPMSGASRVPSRVRGAVQGCFASVSPLAFSLGSRVAAEAPWTSAAPAAAVFFLRGSKAQVLGPPRHQSRPQSCGPRRRATLPKPPLCREPRRGIIWGDFCSKAWLGFGAFGLRGARGRNVTKWQKMRFHLSLAFGLRGSSSLVQPGFCCSLFCLKKKERKKESKKAKTILILHFYFVPMINKVLSLGVDFLNLGRQSLPYLLLPVLSEGRTSMSGREEGKVGERWEKEPVR